MQQTYISQSTIENSPGQAAKNHEENKESKSNPQEDKKKKLTVLLFTVLVMYIFVLFSV